MRPRQQQTVETPLRGAITGDALLIMECLAVYGASLVAEDMVGLSSTCSICFGAVADAEVGRVSAEARQSERRAKRRLEGRAGNLGDSSGLRIQCFDDT